MAYVAAKHHCRNLRCIWDPPAGNSSEHSKTVKTQDGYLYESPFWTGPFPPPPLPDWQPKPNYPARMSPNKGKKPPKEDLDGHYNQINRNPQTKMEPPYAQQPLFCDGCEKEITWTTKTFICLFPTCKTTVCGQCADILMKRPEQGGAYGDIHELKEIYRGEKGIDRPSSSSSSEECMTIVPQAQWTPPVPRMGSGRKLGTSIGADWIKRMAEKGRNNDDEFAQRWGKLKPQVG